MLGNRGLNHAWTNRNAANLIARKIQGNAFGHDHHTALGCLVGRQLGDTFDGGDASGIYDHTTALANHVRNRIFATEVDSFETDVDHPIPLLLAGLDDVLGHVDTGIVEEHVDAAERTQSLVHH